MIASVANLYFLIFASSIPVGGEVGLVWTVPTLNTDGSTISTALTYDVYRSHGSGPFTRVRTGIPIPQATITGNLTPGVMECFAVTAIEDGTESARSGESCVVVPAAH